MSGLYFKDGDDMEPTIGTFNNQPTSQDGKTLHFLKETPAWCVLTLLIVIFSVMWNLTRDDFIPRIIDGLIGGVLASVMGQRPRTTVTPPATNIQAETITAESVNPASMDHAVVNADNFNSENKEK